MVTAYPKENFEFAINLFDIGVSIMPKGYRYIDDIIKGKSDNECVNIVVFIYGVRQNLSADGKVIYGTSKNYNLI